MAKVTVITNNKGGVAKTTTAVNLAAALRGCGFDVLCIDLDGQGNLTDTLGVDTSTVNGTTFDTLKERITPYVPAVRVRQPEGKGVGVLDVLPATRDLFAFEAMIANAADNAIIPTNPDFLSSRGLVSLNDTVQGINGNRTVPLDYRVLFCKYDKRKGLHRLTVEQVRAAFPTFDTVIRDNVALGEAPAAPADIFQYAPRSFGAQDYKAFADEYVKRNRLRHLNHKY